jgi:hypothetical protein
MFILLPGGWSGDMWHCAAATVLCQSDVQNIVVPYPVTIIGMKEKVTDEKDVLNILVDNSISQGKKTYNYFHSLRIPILLARINKLEEKFQPHFSKNILAGSGTYLKTIIDIYEKYCLQEELLFSTIWEATPETERASNESTMALPEGAPALESLSKEELVTETEKKEEVLQSSSEISPPYEFNADDRTLTGPSPLYHLWTSTTIVMQYLHDPKTREERIAYLQGHLSNIANDKAPWVIQARYLAESLQRLASDVGVDGKSAKKVLLFNYRCGDVNKQHDANIALVKCVQELAGEHIVVVPLIVNAPDDEVKQLKAETKCEVLELYKRDTPYDKRYTAAFWAIVANEMQDVVFGLLGGRSGSMDIASFMGVNTCSWDEPVFGDSTKKYKDSYVKAQGGQLLRLLAQRAIMSVVYVDDETFETKKTKGKGTYHAYTRLDGEGLKAWLARKPTDPHISPPLSAALISVSCCLLKSTRY